MIIRTMRFLCYFFSICLWLCGCTIQEEIHFNKDFSGSLTYSIDLANMKSMLSSMKSSFGDSLDTGGDSLGFPNFKEELSKSNEMGGFDKIDGITNFKVDADESGLISFAFDFRDIEALNKAYNQLTKNNQMSSMLNKGNNGFISGDPPSEEETEKPETKTPVEDFNYFTRKGNTIIFRKQRAKMDSNNMNEQLEMLKGMGELMTFQTRITFDKKIKSLKAKNIEHVSDDNSVTLKMTTKDMNADLPNPEVILKLK